MSVPLEDRNSKKEVDSTYVAYIERMIFLLAKRIIWGFKEEDFDKQKWELTFGKLYKNMHVMERKSLVELKISEAAKELAENLGIVPRDDWTIESTSRFSAGLEHKTASEVSSRQNSRHPSIAPKASGQESVTRNLSVGHSRNRWLLPKTSLDSSIQDTSKIEKLLDPSIEEAKELEESQDPQEVTKEINVLEKLVEKPVIERLKTITDEEKVVLLNTKATNNTPTNIVRPFATFYKLTHKQSNKPREDSFIMSKKRPQTPQLYYQGTFDNSLLIETRKKGYQNTKHINERTKDLEISKNGFFVSFKPKGLKKNSDDTFPTIINNSEIVQPDQIVQKLDENFPLDNNFHEASSKRSSVRAVTPLKAYVGSFYQEDHAAMRRTSTGSFNRRTKNDHNKSFDKGYKLNKDMFKTYGTLFLTPKDKEKLKLID